MELPWVFNIRQDPFESYDQAPGPRADNTQHKSYIFNLVLTLVGDHLQTLQAYPPSQRPSSLNVARMIERLTNRPPSPTP
jgi:hypothetical protein